MEMCKKNNVIYNKVCKNIEYKNWLNQNNSIKFIIR